MMIVLFVWLGGFFFKVYPCYYFKLLVLVLILATKAERKTVG